MKQIAVRNKRTTKYMIMYFVSGFQFWNCVLIMYFVSGFQFWNCVFWSHFSINPFKFSNVSQLP